MIQTLAGIVLGLIAIRCLVEVVRISDDRRQEREWLRKQLDSIEVRDE